MADFAIRLLGKKLDEIDSNDVNSQEYYVLVVNTLEPTDRVVKAISISELKKILIKDLVGVSNE